MKQALFFVLVVCITPLASARVMHDRLMARPQPPEIDSVHPVDDPLLMVKLLRQLHVSSGSRHVRAEAIADSRSARALTIPVAGSTPGGGGTLYYRSDVTLANYNATPQDIVVSYWPTATAGNTTPVSMRITVPGNRSVTYTDFVANVMHATGLGALVFVPYNGSAIDPNAAIDGFSRIYTKQPGTDGTVSQEFPAVDVDSLSEENDAASLGLRQDSSFRTNYGIVNADDSPHTFHVVFSGERATTAVSVTVPADAMFQTAIPAGDYGALSITYTVTDPGAEPISWIAYASSTDNVTGDGWVSLASANFNGAQLKTLGY